MNNRIKKLFVFGGTAIGFIGILLGITSQGPPSGELCILAAIFILVLPDIIKSLY